VANELQATLDNCEKFIDVLNIVLIRQKIEMEVTEEYFYVLNKFTGLMQVKLK
jgi:hypothetical protein